MTAPAPTATTAVSRLCHGTRLKSNRPPATGSTAKNRATCTTPDPALLTTCEAIADASRTPRTWRKRVLMAAVPMEFGVTTFVNEPAACSTTVRPKGRCAVVEPAYDIAYPRFVAAEKTSASAIQPHSTWRSWSPIAVKSPSWPNST